MAENPDPDLEIISDWRPPQSHDASSDGPTVVSAQARAAAVVPLLVLVSCSVMVAGAPILTPRLQDYVTSAAARDAVSDTLLLFQPLVSGIAVPSPVSFSYLHAVATLLATVSAALLAWAVRGRRRLSAGLVRLFGAGVAVPLALAVLVVAPALPTFQLISITALAALAGGSALLSATLLTTRWQGPVRLWRLFLGYLLVGAYLVGFDLNARWPLGGSGGVFASEGYLEDIRGFGFGLAVGTAAWAMAQVFPPFSPRRWVLALLTVTMVFGPVMSVLGVTA